ncbi:MAG: hypothetical protein BGO49_14925 [Planctomycetales bacterium 71-10]|nr:MAG: hypothetical protein BGO49_14925 [Planctomycetales bacterium 71-10]
MVNDLKDQKALRSGDASKKRPSVMRRILRRVKAVLGLGIYRRRLKTVRLDWGVRMKCSSDYSQRRLLEQRQWEPHLTKIFFEVVRPGDLVVDIGANIGYFSLLASKLVGPEGRVIAFEPSLRCFRRLCEHLFMNKCDNVIPLNMALSDEKKALELSQPPAYNQGIGTLRPVEDWDKELIIASPLDNILPSELWARVGLVKIDTEGWDYFCLQGMRQLLGSHRPVILAEINSDFYDDLAKMHGEGWTSRRMIEDFFNFVASQGYSVNGHVTEGLPAGDGWFRLSTVEEFLDRLTDPRHSTKDLDLCLVPRGIEVASVQKRALDVDGGS